MNSRLYIMAFGLLLLARPAIADDADNMVWDFSIAGAIRAAPDGEELCRPNPYALHRRGCTARALRFYDRDESAPPTLLDQLAMFVYRYKDLNLAADISPDTRLKFTMNLVTLYEQEAKARVELRIRW